MRFVAFYDFIITSMSLPFIYKNWPFRILGEFGFDKTQFTYVLRNGIKLKNTPEFHIIYDIWRKKVYSPKGFEIKNSDIIIDVGAHKGIFSIYAALQGEQVKVFSYEPVPTNFKLLENNISLNALTQRIKAFNLAVAAQNKTETLFVRDEIRDSATHSFYQRAKGDRPLEVKCTTLDEIFTENSLDKCHLLKLDCQGAEYEILFNSSEHLLKRIDKISMEHHEAKDFKVEDLKEYLQKLGFDVSIKNKYLYAVNYKKL